jgi:ankyrin repeat protein
LRRWHATGLTGIVDTQDGWVNEVATLLLDGGASLATSDVRGRTALHLAVASHNVNLTAQILSHARQLNINNQEPFAVANLLEGTDEDQMSSLHYSAAGFMFVVTVAKELQGNDISTGYSRIHSGLANKGKIHRVGPKFGPILLQA